VTFVDAVLKRLRSCAVRVYVVIRTVVGILAKHRQREQDVPGRKPNVAERAGVMEDYILTSAKVVKGAAGGPGATEPKPGETTGTAGTQRMYDVKGLDNEKLKPLAGQRVQIEGTLADVTPSSKPPAGATPSTEDLPDIRGTVIRQVSGECPPKK
jgi:hypothetical protein